MVNAPSTKPNRRNRRMQGLHRLRLRLDQGERLFEAGLDSLVFQGFQGAFGDFRQAVAGLGEHPTQNASE
jgi:hypothetical protein